MADLIKLKSAALELPTDERLELAEAILNSCDPSESDRLNEIQQAWDREIMRRAAELEDGRVEGIPGSKVFAEIDAEFGWKS